MQSAVSPSSSYSSYDQFYRETYAPVIRAIHRVGRTGATILVAEQGAGDWSDAATPDLVLVRALGPHAPARLDLGGGRFSIVGPLPNGFALTPPDFASSIVVDGPHRIEVLAVPYKALLALAGEDSGLPVDGDFGRLHRGYHVSNEISTLLQAMSFEGAAGRPGGQIWADGALLQLAALLLRSKTGTERRPHVGLAPWQVRRATDVMEARVAEDIGLDDLSATLGLSASHFARAFKSSTGLTPHRWLAERRVSKAKELLVDRRLSLTDVAQMVGFSGQTTFGAAFKRVSGYTPSEYRRLL